MQSNLSDTVKKIFQQKEGNCSQAIFTAYGEQLGLGKVDHDTCLKIASAFGGGIARTGNVCGALTGALMALGLKYGDIERKGQEKANEVAGKFLNEFKSLNGSIICRELINHDLITDNDLKQAFEKGSFNNCPKFVEDVSMMLEKLLFQTQEKVEETTTTKE
ncbi:MAG: C-GCAxxG-C-C family protein [Candidatus Hodarchaeales archaeon]|jgi:C_GCAxxG_C_C family probable redox protein